MTDRIDSKYPSRLRRALNRMASDVSSLTAITNGMEIDYLYYDMTASVEESIPLATKAGQILFRNCNTYTAPGSWTYTANFTVPTLWYGALWDPVIFYDSDWFVIAISIYYLDTWRWMILDHWKGGL